MHSALIEALLRPEPYPHPVSRCELIETHISWVILAGDYVYKIKKPLDLGFLDFSILNKRRFYCEEEIRLNRRLAPNIYLKAIAIGGSPVAPLLESEENIIEYAVKMRRFPQQAQLDRMLAQGELRPAHIDAFACMAAGFHQRAAVADAESDFGEPGQVWQPMAENFMQIQEHLPEAGWDERLKVLEQWSGDYFSRHQSLFSARKRNGFIRECHGDMHLHNLAWVEGKAIAFDGIEFNPHLRWIDVISEIAFLVMDLQVREQPRLAWRFLNHYLQITGDYEGLTLLPIYLVYRAMVRAKVAAIRWGQAGADSGDEIEARRDFTAYVAIAEGFTQPARRAVVITRGMSASGKTTLTGALVERLGAIRLRSDVERKRLFGMRAEEDGRASPGAGIYSAEASERTYERLVQLAGTVLEAGYPVIIDAVCQHRSQRERFMQLARRHAVPCLIVEFVAGPQELRRRIVSREKGASDADLAVLEHQLDSWEPLAEEEGAYSLVVNTEKGLSNTELFRQVSDKLWG